jgi:hypothetical protein
MFTSKRNIIMGKSLDSINGCVKYDTINPFDVPFGQLVYNKNMEYKFQNNRVYLETRVGSNVIYDNKYKCLGLSYYSNNGDNHIVYVDYRGYLNYFNGTNEVLIQELAKEKHKFVMFGTETLSALYGCNATNGVYKVNSDFSYSAIANSPPLTDMVICTINGRNMGVYKHTLYWTEVQQLDADALTNLETWNIDTNNARPTPDGGNGYCAIRDDGQVIYLFKDTLILALPNPEEDVTNWKFPALKAVGVGSGDTVRYVKYGNINGFIYLASDKTLRFLAPKIDRNAGTLPTLYDDIAHIISLNFQTYLDGINDLTKCNATFYNNKYILNFTNNSADINKTLVIDCEKLLPAQNNQYSQPFWYETSNLDANNYTVMDNKLYGTNINGYIMELFNKDKNTDEIPARIGTAKTIDWSIIFGWMKFTENSVEIMKLYLKWATDYNGPINFFSNSFFIGNSLPQFDNKSNVISIYPNTGSGGYEGQLLSDIGEASTLRNEMTTAINPKIRGDYFIFGIYNNVSTQKVIIYGFSPILKQIKTNPISRR